MAQVVHKNMTDPAIHEPKGASTAVIGSVYTSDGTGSGAWIVPPDIDPMTVQPLVGTMIDYAGTTPPTGWFLCGGQEISRSTYSALFAVIGTTFGVGNGSTTFAIPDLRGRVAAGKDNMGGSAAGRLSTTVTGTTLGAVGGAQNHVITTAQTPVIAGTTDAAGAHTHTLSPTTSFTLRLGTTGVPYSSSQVTQNPQNATLSLDAAGEHSHTISINTVSPNSAHNNMQPSIIFNKLIYHGVA